KTQLQESDIKFRMDQVQEFLPFGRVPYPDGPDLAGIDADNQLVSPNIFGKAKFYGDAVEQRRRHYEARIGIGERDAARSRQVLHEMTFGPIFGDFAAGF